MAGAQILGVGKSTPGRVVTNDHFERTLGTSDEWIRKRTGIGERHFVGEGEATSTLATAAGRGALEAAGIDPQDLDLVIVATCSPDHMVPGTSPAVQAGLGATRAGSLDLNAACAGFVYALSFATGQITSGLARHVLVCGAEALSTITNPEDRGTAVVFGDGAGAAVVGPTEGETRIGPFVYGADGSRVSWLYTPAGGSKEPATPEGIAERRHTLHMEGQPVYKLTVEKMVESVRRLLGDEPLDSVDLVIAHQANERIVRAVADRLGLREDQLICNVERYGNTSSATIPITIADAAADGRLKQDMRVILATIGAGFTWTAGWVRWGTE